MSLEIVLSFFYWSETRNLRLEEIDRVFDNKKHFDSDLRISKVEEVTFSISKSKA